MICLYIPAVVIMELVIPWITTVEISEMGWVKSIVACKKKAGDGLYNAPRRAKEKQNIHHHVEVRPVWPWPANSKVFQGIWRAYSIRIFSCIV